MCEWWVSTLPVSNVPREPVLRIASTLSLFPSFWPGRQVETQGWISVGLWCRAVFHPLCHIYGLTPLTPNQLLQMRSCVTLFLTSWSQLPSLEFAALHKPLLDAEVQKQLKSVNIGKYPAHCSFEYLSKICLCEFDNSKVLHYVFSQSFPVTDQGFCMSAHSESIAFLQLLHC